MNRLNRLLSRVECDPPLFTAEEISDWPPGLPIESVLRIAAPATTAPCPACDGEHTGRVVALDRSLRIVCRQCGPSPVSSDVLRRWELSIPALLEQLSPTLGLRSTVSELIALGLLSAAVGVQPSASAQTAIPYFLMQETAPYVARTGTVLQFGSDDDDEVVLTLPFAFHFFEQNYAQVHVSTNGYVSFTELARSLDNTGFPDSAMPNAVISGFWDDLLVNEVLTTVEGMAPGRVFIIQWDCSRFGDSSSQLQMQLWLYEGVAGRFELRYGPAMTGSPTTTFEASIGFEDVGGRVGNSWLSCSPNCGDADLAQTRW